MPRPRGSRKEQAKQARIQLAQGKLLGYIRVSTVGQAEEGHSLAGQGDRLAQACEALGFSLVDTCQDVASGTKTDRDGLAEAMRRVEEGEAEGLVFAKLDRITRSLAHGAKLVEWARKGGFTLYSVDEGGVMVRQGELANEALPIFLAIAQIERERISRRTKEGLAAAKRKGVKLGNPNRITADHPTAKRAVKLRAKGLTIERVAAKLNAEGRPTARGNQWASGNTYTLLKRVAPEVLPEGGAVKKKRA